MIRQQSDTSLIRGPVSQKILLTILEAVFCLSHSLQLCDMVQHLPGRLNVWADPMSQFMKSLVDWHLKTFHILMTQFGCLNINLFTAPYSHHLPLFLTHFGQIPSRLIGIGGHTSTCSHPQQPLSFFGCIIPCNPALSGTCLFPFGERPNRGTVSCCSGAPCCCLSPQTATRAKASHSWGCPCSFTRGVSHMYAFPIVDSSSGCQHSLGSFSLHNQYEFCWKACQCFMASFPITYMLQNIVFQFPSSLCHERNFKPPTSAVYCVAIKDLLFHSFQMSLDPQLELLKKAFF